MRVTCECVYWWVWLLDILQRLIYLLPGTDCNSIYVKLIIMHYIIIGIRTHNWCQKISFSVTKFNIVIQKHRSLASTRLSGVELEVAGFQGDSGVEVAAGYRWRRVASL